MQSKALRLACPGTRRVCEGVAPAWTYDAFGEVRTQSGVLSTDFLFTGEQRDGESDLYYLRARYYDPSIGRFGSDSNPRLPDWKEEGHPTKQA
jgi:RHS repeat-associated protein